MRAEVGGHGSYFLWTVLLISNLFLLNEAKAQGRFRGDFYPGDAVKVIVWQDPTKTSITKLNIGNLGISDDYIIDRRGYIFMPLIGEVRAVGRSKKVLADTLQERYNKFVSGLYFVCKPLIRLTVMGEVNKPGSYLVERTASLWEVISKAGGPKPSADLSNIFLTRGGDVVEKNLLEVYEKAYSLREIGVKSGDQLVIPHPGRSVIKYMREYGSFVMSVAILYLQIRRFSK